MPKIEKMLNDFGLSPTYKSKDSAGRSGSWHLRAQFDSGDVYNVIDYVSEEEHEKGNTVKDSLEKILEPYLK